MNFELKISVLTDNNTKRDSHLLSEHGLSFCIECDKLKLLFDTGDTDIYLKNAAKMKINLESIDYIALSHNHYDHVGGVKYFPTHNREIKLIAEKYAFYPRVGLDYKNDLSEHAEEISEKFDIISVDSKPFKISENLIFLGAIPCLNNFEKIKTFGKLILPSGELIDDFCEDDTALIYNSQQGLIIITGCSHSGICNITQYATVVAEKEWGTSKVKTIIGGLHLINSGDILMKKIVDFLRKKEISEIYPCHCTDLAAKITLTKSGLKIHEVGTGLVMHF